MFNYSTKIINNVSLFYKKKLCFIILLCLRNSSTIEKQLKMFNYSTNKQ
jgi:hypothetical protein